MSYLLWDLGACNFTDQDTLVYQQFLKISKRMAFSQMPNMRGALQYVCTKKRPSVVSFFINLIFYLMGHGKWSTKQMTYFPKS